MSAEIGGSKIGNVIKAKEDLQKSPEQLEKEKREIINSRLPPINLDRLTKDDMIQQAKKFHQTLINLHTQIYELMEKHERQKYDMMELTNRAIQIERGKAKTRKSNVVHTGLGGSVLPFIAETYTSAPGKISLFSRYERVTDRRTFKDRRDVWAITKEKKYKEMPEKPKAKLAAAAPSRKAKQAEPEEEETHEKSNEEESAPAEEAPAEVEAPAEDHAAEEEEEEEEEEE
jgi:hypothetical protein